MSRSDPLLPDPFAAPPPVPHPRIRVGIGGWIFAPWRSNFYPAGLPQRRELEYASRRLTAIEINGTFYGAKKPENYASWRDQTPPGFVFSLKAPQSITQRGALAGKRGAIEDFVAGALHLGDRLGPILWQFAPAARLQIEDLAAFAALLPRQADGKPLRHVFEIRNPATVGEGFVAMARAARVATVFTDSPEHPSFADVTADFVYARLMRSRAETATGYADAELTAWAQRARQWAEGSEPSDLPRVAAPGGAAAPRDVFVFFIGAGKERNPAAAQALQQRL